MKPRDVAAGGRGVSEVDHPSLTARVYEKNGRYLWVCTACQKTMPLPHYRNRETAVIGASQHNGSTHDDGRLDVARGDLDPRSLTAASCAKCATMLMAGDNVRKGGIIVPLPVLVRAADLRTSPPTCGKCNGPLRHPVLAEL